MNARGDSSTAIEVYDSVEPVAGEWETLADRLGASPFTRPGWIDAWHRSFGGGRLAVVAARRGKEIVGVFPVIERRGVLNSPTNWHTPSFQPLAEDADVTGTLVGALLARRPRRFDLAFLDPGSEVFDDCVRTARSHGYRTVCRVVQRSPYVQVVSDWASFESTVPARRRKKIRRCRRRLEELGSLTIELVDGSRDLNGLLQEGFAIESSGWKGEEGTAILASPETARFYREVADWAAARGWLRLWFLRLDGKALAFAFCIEHGGAHYDLEGWVRC